MTPPDGPLQLAILRLIERRSLSAAESGAAFDVLMRGEAGEAEMTALLIGLLMKGETAEEIAGAASALRRAMVPVSVDDQDALVDTCGTGGGRVGTLNISTAAAFVVAGAGVPVAKHGNRSFTSRSGSADVLEALGVDIELTPAAAAKVLGEVGLCFLFAPSYHPAMRHVAPVRRQLGIPTVMNLLGPLANPAGARRQVVGVADAARGPLLAEALQRLGAIHALVVHAEVGMDEISPAGTTMIWEVRPEGVHQWSLDPAEFELAHADLAPLAGGDPTENARRIESLLRGHDAPGVRQAVLLNAAAALYVSGRVGTFEEAGRRVSTALRRGAGAEVLDRLRRAAPAGIKTS